MVLNTFDTRHNDTSSASDRCPAISFQSSIESRRGDIGGMCWSMARADMACCKNVSGAQWAGLVGRNLNIRRIVWTVCQYDGNVLVSHLVLTPSRQGIVDRSCRKMSLGACRMHWEEWIRTCESSIDLIISDLTSLLLDTNLWSEYPSPRRKYFQASDASIRWHLRGRNFLPCSQSMSVEVILTTSCYC
jgi:hypothetical protein